MKRDDKGRKVGISGERWGKVGKSGHFGLLFLPKSIGTSLTTDYSMSVATSMAVSIMNLIRALVSQLRETQALACGGGGGDGVRTKTIISPKFQISGI